MKKKQPQPIDEHTEIVVSRQFSGPLPPPDALEKYNNIVFGAAERILKMAENEAEARHLNERKLVDNAVRSSFLGIFFAFASVILMIVLAFYAIMHDYPTVATSIVVVNLASVAGIFIFFRTRKIHK